MIRKGLFLCIAIILLASFQQELLAQCAMCKAALESNMQSGEDAVGKGINSGIMYIMLVPYILLGTIGYFMYKHFKKTNQSVNN